MTISIKSLSPKEKFIQRMNEVIEKKSSYREYVNLITKNKGRHILWLCNYERFIKYNHENMITTMYIDPKGYVLDEFDYVKSKLNFNDVIEIEFLAKGDLINRATSVKV